MKSNRNTTRLCMTSLHWVLLFALYALAGCGPTGPARSAVKGSVAIGGQPLAAGRIIFTPVSPNKGPVATARIIAGKYHAAKADGPVIGKNRVEVEADLNLGFALDDEEAFSRRGSGPLPQSPIPSDFNSTAQLSVEIRPGETNQYDVPIPAASQTANYH